MSGDNPPASVAPPAFVAPPHGGPANPGSANDTNPAIDVTPADAYPVDTPVTEMTPVQQAAYWKAMSRKHESRAKALGTPDEIKRLRDDAAELAKAREASMGEQERAVATARNEAAAETARAYALRLVAAEFRAATAGRIDREELDATLDPLDLAKFLNANGEVDAEHVAEYARRIAPAKADGKTPFPDLGQGRRTTTAVPGVASGRAAYAARLARKGQQERGAIGAANNL